MDTTIVVGAGAVLVGLGALLRGRGAKVEAEAATETAAAKAVTELVAQMGDMRRDLEREQAAREMLGRKVSELSDQLASEKSTRMHLESQIHILTLEAQHERNARQSAEKWASSLAQEMAELRRALNAGNTKLTLPPPWNEG